MSYMQHHFNIEIAKKFGINVAIFLDHMAFWITKNIANNINFHDENFWTYNTVEAYTDIFPYWSTKQMRKVLSDCQKYGLINTGNYNEKKYDSKKWYSLTEYGAKLLNITICPKGQMDLSKRANGFVQKGKPIAVTNTVTNTVRESEKPEHKKRVPLSEFKPNDQNKELSKKLSIDLEKELESFKKRHSGKGDLQYEFERWLNNAKAYLDSKNIVSIHKKEEPQRPKYRDFTQERLDREERERMNNAL